MALETASYVADLTTTNPTATDPKSQGDDHLRLIKTVLKNTFAGFPGLVVGTGTEAQGATASDYVVTLSPAPAAYTAGFFVAFKATHANIGAATVQVNALAIKPLIAVDGSALHAGDIESGGLVVAFYDGASFYLISGNDRADRNGETYSGTHDFTGATVTMPQKVDSTNGTASNLTLTGTPTAPTLAPGDNSTKLATTAFVVQQAFLAALPVQPGGSSTYFLTSTGGIASWGNGAPDFLLMAQGVI